MDCDAALEIAVRIFESGEAAPDQNALDLLFVLPRFFFSFISLFVNLFIEVFIHLSPRRRVKLKTTSLCPLIQEVIVIVAHPSQQAGHYF